MGTDDVATTKTAVGVLIGLTSAYFVALMGVFYRKRHLQPIKARPFRTTFFSFPLLWVYAMCMALRYIWTDGSLPCLILTLFGGPSVAVALNMYLIRVWIVWFQYKSTIEKTKLASVFKDPYASVESRQSSPQLQGRRGSMQGRRGSMSAKHATVVATWYLDHQQYGKDKFLLKLFLAKSSVEVLVIQWGKTFLFWPDIFTATYDPLVDEEFCPLLGVSLWVFMALCLYDAMICVYASFKFGVVEDSLFLKQELRNSGVIGIVACVGWVTLAYSTAEVFANAWLILSMCALLTNSALYPIWKTYKVPQPKATYTFGKSTSSQIFDSRGDEALPHFEKITALLAHEDGRAAFRRHLELEFSVENLLFWEAVEEFRDEFVVGMPMRNHHLAQQVVRRFIDWDAPLQVNIAHTTRNAVIHAIQSGHTVDITLFDDVQRAVTLLMASDSFMRFRTILSEERSRREESIGNSHVVELSEQEPSARSRSRPPLSPRLNSVNSV